MFIGYEDDTTGLLHIIPVSDIAEIVHVPPGQSRGGDERPANIDRVFVTFKGGSRPERELRGDEAKAIIAQIEKHGVIVRIPRVGPRGNS